MVHGPTAYTISPPRFRYTTNSTERSVYLQILSAISASITPMLDMPLRQENVTTRCSLLLVHDSISDSLLLQRYNLETHYTHTFHYLLAIHGALE